MAYSCLYLPFLGEIAFILIFRELLPNLQDPSSKVTWSGELSLTHRPKPRPWQNSLLALLLPSICVLSSVTAHTAEYAQHLTQVSQTEVPLGARQGT